MTGINCVVVTPEATALDVTAEFIAVPLFDGEKGVAAGHSPMIGRLGYGELRVKTKNGTDRFYVDGGFVQIADNVVSVITNRAIPAGEIDVAAAKEQLEAARNKPANSDELRELKDKSITQARAQLKVAATK